MMNLNGPVAPERLVQATGRPQVVVADQRPTVNPMTTTDLDLPTELGNMLEGGHGNVLREMLSTMLHAVMVQAEAACAVLIGDRHPRCSPARIEAR